MPSQLGSVLWRKQNGCAAGEYDPEDHPPDRAAAGDRLHRELHRSDQCQLREVRYGRDVRDERDPVRVRRGHLLRRLRARRGAEQYHHDQGGRADLAQPDPGDLGHHRDSDCVRGQRGDGLPAALSARRGRGGLLSRHHRVSHPLVPECRAHQGDFDRHGGDSGGQRARQPAQRLDSRHLRRCTGIGRLALGVHRRRHSGGAARRGVLLRAHRDARAGEVAQRGRTGLAHRDIGGRERRTRAERPRRASRRTAEQARTRAVPGLLPAAVRVRTRWPTGCRRWSRRSGTA